MTFFEFALFKAPNWLSKIPDEIMGTILSGIRTILFEIMVIVYKLLVLLYELFEKLCTARILSNEVINTMSQRIGLLLGLVMFFYVIFSLIQMLLDPNKITDKENGAGAIVKKSILVIALLGISNFGFELLYDIQNTIIRTGVISKIILPYTISGNPQENFGNILSLQLVRTFYQVDPNIKNIYQEDEDKLYTCGNDALVGMFYEDVYYNNSYNIGYICLNESVRVKLNNVEDILTDSTEDEVFLIKFDGILAIAVGIFVAYMLLMYCFKVGVRMIQLAFLEIISPMAIISHLSPKKDNMFSKWKSIYFSTYIDVFIRIAIINFVIFLVCTLYSVGNDGEFPLAGLGSSSNGESLFFMVVILLALLTFAKKAPDLIKELLPNAGKGLGFGLGMKDIWGLEKVGKAATGIVGGALGGAAIGLIGGGIGGTIGGLLKGGLSGLKGQGFGKTATSAWKSQQASNKRIRDWRAAGGGPLPFGRWGAAFNQWRGADTLGDIDTREIEKLDNYAKIQDMIEATADNYKNDAPGYEAINVKTLKKNYESIKEAGRIGTESDADYLARINKAENAWKDARKEFINRAMSNDPTLVDDASADLIRHYQEQLNREISSNSELFSGFKSGIDTYKAMDDNTILAKNRSSGRKTTREYAKNQADAKYSGRK